MSLATDTGFVGILRRIVRIREFALIAVLIVFCAIMSFVSPVFLTTGNFLSLLIGLSVEGLIAIGMVLVMITGSFDLSVGATLAFTGVVAGLLLNAGVPVYLSIFIALLCSLAVGLVNGILIAKFRINAFIVTLGMMLFLTGLLLVLANGTTILNLPQSFNVIGQGKTFGIQNPIWITIILVIAFDLAVRNLKFFRRSYYVGGNPNAARLSGIKVDRVNIINFCIVAVLAGLAGILVTARFGAASVTIGGNTALDVIAAAIIGGSSLSGGEGSIIGGFLGAFFIGLIQNALNLIGVDSYWQSLVTGAVLIIAVLVDVLGQRRRGGRRRKGAPVVGPPTERPGKTVGETGGTERVVHDQVR